MPDLSRLNRLREKCEVPPPDVPLIEREDWEPPQEDVDALMAELEQVLTDRQLRILGQTCRRFVREWEWASWDELSREEKLALYGDAVSHVLQWNRGGQVTATDLGRRWFDWHKNGTPAQDRYERLHATA